MPLLCFKKERSTNLKDFYWVKFFQGIIVTILQRWVGSTIQYPCWRLFEYNSKYLPHWFSAISLWLHFYSLERIIEKELPQHCLQKVLLISSIFPPHFDWITYKEKQFAFLSLIVPRLMTDLYFLFSSFYGMLSCKRCKHRVIAHRTLYFSWLRSLKLKASSIMSLSRQKIGKTFSWTWFIQRKSTLTNQLMRNFY